jgi:hypothetical protein
MRWHSSSSKSVKCCWAQRTGARSRQGGSPSHVRHPRDERRGSLKASGLRGVMPQYTLSISRIQSGAIPKKSENVPQVTTALLQTPCSCTSAENSPCVLLFIPLTLIASLQVLQLAHLQPQPHLELAMLYLRLGVLHQQLHEPTKACFSSAEQHLRQVKNEADKRPWLQMLKQLSQ